MPHNTSTFIRFAQELEEQFKKATHSQTLEALLALFKKNEEAEEAKLHSLINNNLINKNSPIEYKAEIVCCIDPRERNVRTILETFSTKTYGYSGSLGLPLQVVDTIENRTYQSCPGWITPEHTVHVGYDAQNKIKLTFDIEIPFEKEVQYALQLCKTIGLTKSTAPFIIFMGHKGELPECKYKEQMLHCGACEGNPGEINNRVMAAIFQKPEVRKALRQEGVILSEQTIFLAAEHNTNTGEISILTACDLTTEKEEYLELLTLLKNTQEEYVNRKLTYSGLKNKDELLQSSPFVSLAGNKGILIGPPEILKGLDQKEKYFLQSYDYTNDLDGTLLKNLLTGPVRVAFAINTLYLFSTITLLNTEKSTSEPSIPKSLIFDAENNPQHQLMRFFVIIHAPHEVIKKCIKTEPALELLINAEWLHLISIAPNNKLRE